MIRALARRVLPSQLRHWLSRRLGYAMRYSGPYPSWDAAMRCSSGYDQAAILERVSATSSRVAAGEFAFEQDSVGFPEPSPPTELLHALTLASQGAPRMGLTVLDFGGSLGSLFHRVRPFLGPIRILRWVVCEQDHFVEAGKRSFERAELAFSGDPAVDPGTDQIDLLVLSSVLPYLETPLDTLRKLASLRPRWILVDRNPLSPDENDHLLVQHTPKSIYQAAYPIWLLSRSSIMRELEGTYATRREFDVAEGPVMCGSLRGPYRGMLLQRLDDAAAGG